MSLFLISYWIFNVAFAIEPSKQSCTSSVEVIPYEKLLDHQLDSNKLDQISEVSKKHVIGSSSNQILSDELELLDVELVYEMAPSKIGSNHDGSAFSQQISQNCINIPSDPLKKLEKNFDGILNKIPPKKKRYIYFSWGYNRNFHSKSDATFTTNSGTFTIHDAIGKDRPSKDIMDYISPSRIPIPQYNLRVGYELNDQWDIVAGLDHMKWVFQNQIPYEVTGEYNHTVFVPHYSGDPNLLTGMTFDQVKETGDMRWLSFDHTNGYNYAHLGAIRKSNLYTSKKGSFKINTGIGAGAGLMIPQTTVKYHQDQWWNWQGVDNKFHVAGYGAHAEAKLQLEYKSFFIEPMARGTYIKVKNALVQESGERLEHSPIGSIQFIVQGGYKIPIKDRKKSRK